jgi:hypothetical protein
MMIYDYADDDRHYDYDVCANNDDDYYDRSYHDVQ